MNIGSKLSTVKSVTTSKAGLSLLKGRKHAPVILFAAGVVGFGATIVLASKATLQLSDVLEHHENEVANAHDLHELSRLDKADYSTKQYKRDLVTIKTVFVKDVARLYAPAIGVGVLSVGALTGSHVILNRRYTSVVAAYATLDRSFKEYRGRVVESYGSETDKKFVNGTTTREIASDDGQYVQTVEEANGRSPYAKLFAKETTYEWNPGPDYNLYFLRAQQQIANDNLNSRGYVFLNDVYKSLGLDPIPAGQAVGWFKDNPRGGNNYVDFGIFENPDAFNDFMRGKEGAIWLDFNVDGVVYDLI